MFYNKNMYFILSTLIFITFIIAIIINKKKQIIISYGTKRIIQMIFATCFVVIYIYFFYVHILRGDWYEFSLGDLCPFIAFFIILPLYFNGEKILKAIAPGAFIGACITIIAKMVQSGGEPLNIDTPSGRHMTLLAFSLYTPFVFTYSKQDVKNTFIFIVLFIVWVIVSTGFLSYVIDLKFKKYTTALYPETYKSENDYNFFGKTGIPGPLPTIIFYTGALLTNGLLIFLNNKLHNFIYKNKKVKLK